MQPIVVETDGSRPVVIKRTDIHSGTREFHRAALLANTVAAKNINLDTELIREVMVEEFGVNVEELGVEVEDITGVSDVQLPEELDGIDMTPDGLDKISGDDSVEYDRIIIVYPPDRKAELEGILGITVSKVVFRLDELAR
jgi:hypothetical protein